MKRSMGFTLVELLLAVTLLSILMAMTYGGMRAATRAADRGQAILEESGRLRMAHQFVRRQINQAVPLAFSQEEASEAGAAPVSEVFRGTADTVRFVGPMPGYLGFGGPQVQELRLVRAGDGLELHLAHALVQGFEESLLDERDPILLLDGIEQGQFQYLELDESGEIVGWTPDWLDTEKMPLAVALDIDLHEGAYTDWPLLVAAVRVDGSSISAALGGENNYRSAIRELIERRRRQD